MSYFFVTYDLVHHASEEQYKDLIDELKSMKSHRSQASVWLTDWSGTASTLYDLLRQHMHKDDRLLVLQYFNNSSWQSASYKGTNDWLTTRCGPSS